KLPLRGRAVTTRSPPVIGRSCSRPSNAASVAFSAAVMAPSMVAGRGARNADHTTPPPQVPAPGARQQRNAGQDHHPSTWRAANTSPVLAGGALRRPGELLEAQ